MRRIEIKIHKQTQVLLKTLFIVIVCLTACVQAKADVYGDAEAKVLRSLSALNSHIADENVLDETTMEQHKAIIDKYGEIFDYSEEIIKASFDLVATYENTQQANWIYTTGFHRKKGIPNNIKWTMISVLQNIVDHVYTAKNIAEHTDLLNGFKFKCADHFPGKADPPESPTTTHTVKLSASFPKSFGRLDEGFARKPTGTYLAPGSIATVTVPKSIVGKGYQVRVGSHSWDFSRKPRIQRLDRISVAYEIDSTELKVANPLGGGIYIEVPYLADSGVVEVKVQNAIRSPYFSVKSFHKTSLAEWKETERNFKAPFADFQTEKFMLNVPTSWIYALDDPISLMKDWDSAIDTANDLMGLPRIRGRETMYPQVDLMMKASAYAPGYPSSNLRFNPASDSGGYSKHHLIRGPQYASSYEFHEQGHGYFFVKFPGEVESLVNLPHVAVWHQQFGYSLDEAFRTSRRSKNEIHTLETTAITWMTSPNFSNKIPMEPLEKKYQLKGHAKYVDIARLLGWETLHDFWYSINLDFENGKEWSRHRSDIDKLLLRLSESTKVDIRPLFHFWGTPPNDADALNGAIQAEKLPQSAKIYDTLLKYKSLVPKDNKAFQDFALKWWGKQPRSKGFTTEQGHAAQWDTYDEKSAAHIQMTVQEIIDAYFPDGRP